MSTSIQAAGPEERANVATIGRWLDSFNGGRWPTEAEAADLLAPEVKFVERPSMVSPSGSERDLKGMLAGMRAGAALLAEQRYEPLEHIAHGSCVVSRIRWTGTIGVDAGPWTAGTTLSAWCLAVYRLVDGRIVHIEQFDCYDAPETLPS